MIVTIDGPAGTGKSTVARTLADRLGFEFLNTGAMYRTVAYACLKKQLPLDDEQAVADETLRLKITFANNRVLLGDQDVTDAIRQQEVTQSASIVAAHPAVRSRLVDLQRKIAHGINLVTEGRDQGTIVFPNADCKFFLTASPEERARRRLRELEEKGEQVSLEELLEQQSLRDYRDETRACSPLQPAPNAIIIDTTDMTIAHVTGRLEQIVAAASANSSR
ncbi:MULTISPECIES: (d)CMP kinase [unclassified Schlesneria]|uniref:(d)CMP kinase n=1 Tax=unclassified Schlesneria TaxID=2762017 RepID=UPI002F05E968